MNASPPVSSPCIDVCAMDAKTGLCTGCGRTLDEIANWSAMSETRRREIMAELAGRMAAALAPKPEARR